MAEFLITVITVFDWATLLIIFVLEDRNAAYVVLFIDLFDPFFLF